MVVLNRVGSREVLLFFIGFCRFRVLFIVVVRLMSDIGVVICVVFVLGCYISSGMWSSFWYMEWLCL